MISDTPSTSSIMPVIIGNPYAPTGRGVTALSHFRALRRAGLRVSVCDVWSRQHSIQAGPGLDSELGEFLVTKPGKLINVYHLNADEITQALEKLKVALPDGAYNILYPFWELSKCPKEWLRGLDLFDEIWAPSLFVEEALRSVTSTPLSHMPLPVEIQLSSMLGRSYFGLPDSSYVFLFFFDFRSYIARKNPQAVFQVFENVVSLRPYADVRIVIKVHGTGISEKAARDYQQFVSEVQSSRIADRILLIDRVYSDDEMKNLVRCCDCVMSLHRSEGYGLGLAEAMYLGKPVIGTGYSGNLDFMTRDNSCLVDYTLIPVNEGEYPHWQGQVWADPDLEQGAFFAGKLLEDVAFGRELGKRASRHIRTYFSYLALGLRYKERLEQISRSLPPRFGDSAPEAPVGSDGLRKQGMSADPIIL